MSESPATLAQGPAVGEPSEPPSPGSPLAPRQEPPEESVPDSSKPTWENSSKSKLGRSKSMKRERAGQMFSAVRSHLSDKMKEGKRSLTVETFTTTHHFSVTSTGRVKMLHCDDERVPEHWRRKEVSQLQQSQEKEDSEEGVEEQRVARLYFATEPTTKNGETTDAQSDTEDSGHGAGLSECMVEFEHQNFPIREDSEELPVAVVRRIGNMSNRIELKWRILNGTINPKLSSQLVPTSGTVVFEPGQERAYITGPLVDDPAWNAESFYYIKLLPESLEGQSVWFGRNTLMRVFHVNVNRFPADVPEKATTFRLVCGFWRHNYQELARETRMGCLLMLMTGLLFLLERLSFKYIVDCGASSSPEETCTGGFLESFFTGMHDNEGGRNAPLILLVLFRVGVHLMENIQERAFRRLRLAGKATRKLRHHLFTTLLQMSNDARMQYDIGDIPEVMNVTSADAVKLVWMGLFQTVQKLSVMVGSCVIFAQAIASTESLLAKVSMAVAAPIMLLVVTVVVHITGQTGQKLRDKVIGAEQNWVSLVQMTENCYDVVVGYRESDDMALSINGLHGNINKGWVGFDDHNAHFRWILRWCFHIVQAVVLVTTGLAARNGNLQIGEFVIVNATLLSFANTLIGMSVLVKTITNQAQSVREIAKILNSDTKRKVLLRRGMAPNQQRPKEAAAVDAAVEPGQQAPEGGQADGSGNTPVTPASTAAICLNGVSYSYKSGAEKTTLSAPKVWLNMEAGQLVCWPRIEGHEEHVGVNTIFKMLAGIIVPHTGSIKLPPWWRIIYVPVTPILFDGTLMYNLTYGASKTIASEEEDEQIIWSICKRLGFSSELIGKDFYDVDTGGSRLRSRDRILVAITRALLHDVDLLLLSSALDVLGSEQGVRVLKYLHEYVKNRGINGRNPFPWALRHRKTVLYSTKFATLQGQDSCDSLIKLHGREPVDA